MHDKMGNDAISRGPCVYFSWFQNKDKLETFGMPKKSLKSAKLEKEFNHFPN